MQGSANGLYGFLDGFSDVTAHFAYTLRVAIICWPYCNIEVSDVSSNSYDIAFYPRMEVTWSRAIPSFFSRHAVPPTVPFDSR